MKNWMIAIVAVFALGMVLFLSDRKVETPSGVDLIRNPNQYSEANSKAALLAFDIFRKADNGESISEDDKAKLREAEKYFEAMRLYNPTVVQSNFGAGKCFMLIGEKERAAERFEQAVMNKDIDQDKSKPNFNLTVYESMALLSEVTLDLAVEEIANQNSLSQANDMVGAAAAKKRSDSYFAKALDYSNKAVVAVPTATRYLIGRANILLALKRDADAKKDIAQAKKLSPNDPRVKMLAKLVGI